ncbi:glycosyltransferase family 9 protein [Rhodopila sp.]|uniref:glycosyltransferase family 9 protein n=1 Tax=Rhodopila sp. TaxID=2480087 RepID=UPI003D0BC505
MPPDAQATTATRPAERITRQNILVVKLGAFGNIILSLAAFAAIRQHHSGARISVLTSQTYAGWLRDFPYFDDVLVDPRPRWWDLAGLHRLGRTLADGQFARVYDLQTSARSSRYFRLFPAKHRPQWSGIAFGCALPDRDPRRNVLHDTIRQQGQLRQAGISVFPPADLSWCRGDIARFALPADFALLVPGSSPSRPAKRWPAARYQSLAQLLRQKGIAPVVIGSASEQDLAAQIPSAIDLTGQTGFGDLADLARAAQFAVGNDTGPMHLLATAGCATTTLFSADSNPSQCAPSGRWTRVLQRPDLADLAVETVLQSLPTDACPTGDADPTDAGPTDAGPIDARPTGAGPTGASLEDVRPEDAGPIDARATDA